MYTLTTKKDYMSLNTILIYILIGVIVISLINLFIGNSILNLIISVVVMILFSFFIIVNTQEVLYTDIEPLDAACSLYLDILNMFIALLNILTSFSKD
jgi:modulator of FtsH protease